MDDLDKILGMTEIPDPGRGYWESFSRRVDAMLPPQGTTFWTMFRRRAVLFASSAAVGLLTAFIAVSLTGDRVAPGLQTVKPVVAASRVTVTLSSDSGSQHTILVLNNSAKDKLTMAREACERGQWDSIAPLARSFEKILSVGLTSSLDKAAESDEDLNEFIDDMLETASDGAAGWKKIAAVADSRAGADLTAAIKASENLAQTLDERFGKSRG